MVSYVRMAIKPGVISSFAVCQANAAPVYQTTTGHNLTQRFYVYFLMAQAPDIYIFAGRVAIGIAEL